MKTAQAFLLSAFLLAAVSHAQQDIQNYLVTLAFDSGTACQLKYQICGSSQTSSDYCSLVKSAKQCATTGSVLTNGSIAICTNTEYQRALDVACMSVEERQKLGELINAINQLSPECHNVIPTCYGPLISTISLKEYCNAIKEADACMIFYASVKQSCNPKYEEIKALACSAQNINHTISQNIVQNITVLILACVLSLISRDLLVK